MPDGYLYIYKGKRLSRESLKKGRRQSSVGESQEGFFEKKTAETRSDSRKKDEPKTPYIVLSVGKGASKEEIKKSYRRLVNKYHPDKVLHLGEEFRELAEMRFKEIQKAYEDLMSK